MDKAEFIEKAPRYYALAVLSHLLVNMLPITKFDVIEAFAYYDEDAQDSYQRIESGALLNAAIKLLVAENLITLELDDFAPELIIPSDSLPQELIDLSDLGVLYDRYRRAGAKRDAWLRDGLDQIYRESRRLNIKDSDYDNPEAEWSPITVDRDQPETQALINAVEDAAEKLRADNGYAATKPAERDYVVDGLALFLKRIKESAVVSIPYVRQYAIAPLSKAAKSLGRSATGVAVDVARTELKNWLLKLGIPWPFDWL